VTSPFHAITQRFEVAWCTKVGSRLDIMLLVYSHAIQNGTGARLIPDGTITSAHFVQTPDFIQITGELRALTLT